RDRRAERELEALRRSYPDLPQADELSFRLAEWYEARGDRERAGRVYRQLDLLSPGTKWAERARRRAEALRAEGVNVRELTLVRQVERTERLIGGGYYELARPEIARLRAMALPRTLLSQLARAEARMARVEGRWADAERLLREAQGLPSLGAEQAARLAEQAQDFARAAEPRDAENARRSIRGLLRGRPLSRQSTARVLSILQIAARAGLRDVVDEALRDVARRDRLPPGVRFDAAILGAGTGDDALVAELFASVREHPRYAVAARYHHARTLERLGRIEEARAEYREVIARDDPRLPYYALWARLRLRETAHVRTRTPEPLAVIPPASVSCSAGPFTPPPEGLAAKVEGLGANDVTCLPQSPLPSPIIATTIESPDSEPAVVDPIAEADAAAEHAELRGGGETYRPLSPDEIARLLEPLADACGEAYPWIGRALDLVRLGELDAAAEELHEAYVAWRDARGGGSLRAGYVAVLRGSAPPRHRVSPRTWRDRRTLLDGEARRRLARAAAALGDHGLAIRFDGFGVAGPRPRAYAQIVEEAARRHGVEPELLFAVMRVESVYNPRIISYAGAIGLMQIMPRTGRLIAKRLGREDFTVDQLLDPEVNIDFAAWYLSSLIERFDGRLPLAIAAYNGGPHNVRRWMREHSESMPLDAFLERIPFSQTHRYVRRVLTHYAAYRAQRGLAVAQLDVRLPAPAPDSLAF
ncbi:MAG TPA: transglycosylase SLT domain-containing protein, partial [Sandaracinaceae bacterium]